LLYFGAVDFSDKSIAGGVLLAGEYPHQDCEKQLRAWLNEASPDTGKGLEQRTWRSIAMEVRTSVLVV
jgi:hypothetical protein